MDGKKVRDGKSGAGDGGDRRELAELLRLFSALGLTVACGIVGFFLLGLHVDRWLVARGWETRGIPRIVLVLAGVALSVYWAYIRIARHLERFDPPRRDGDSF